MSMTDWYHRCCSHSAQDIIENDLTMEPKYQQILGARLSWFTFAPHATARALGLDSHVLVKCDRMEFRFTVVPDDRHLIVPWSSVARKFQMGTYLEGTKGTRPTLWGVAFEPVRVMQ